MLLSLLLCIAADAVRRSACQGGTWYDQLCGTTVEFNPYVRLTETQKNWRKFYKNRR